ncbi:TPA: hypothetical protein ACH3X1_006438 [Trebouxia sp. C0004]
MTQAWEYILVHVEVLPGSETPQQFFAWIRKDADVVLKELLDSPQANGMCLESQPVFDENNQRIYIDFESGKWLEEKQKEIRLKLQTLAVVLGLIFYSDGAEAQRKGHKYHPLLMYFANFMPDAMRSQRGYARLAHMSVLDKADFPLLTQNQFTRLQRQILFATLHHALKDLKTLSHIGFQHKCTDGVERFFLPTAAAYVGDIKEANDVFGIAPHPAPYSDIRTLIKSDRFNDPDVDPPPRTERVMREVMQDVKDLFDQDMTADAKKLMQ